MEPLAVGAVVALMADYAARMAGGMLDSAVADRLRRVWDTVAGRFRGDPVAEGALNRLQDQPDNTRRQGAVHDHLQEIVNNDPAFTQLLTELVRAASEANEHDAATRVKNSGAVAMDQGRIEMHGTYTGGRDIHVHGLPGSEPSTPSARPEGE